MSRTFLKTALMTGILAGFLGSAQAQNLEQFAGVQPSVLHDFRVVTVADGLEVPWSMAWLPNGDMLVTEAKAGRLRVIRDGVLQPEPISGVPEVFNMGQGGLFDVLPHPDFESNQLVYLSYSKPLGGRDSTTVVIRGRLANGALNDVEEIFVANASGASHFGGRMAFDDEGYLFVTLGDRQAPPTGDLANHPAQSLANHHGVIVRLNDDGSVPSDNPFVGQSGAEPAIYSYGHRSPQGLAIHPETGVILMTEHGPQGGDELNIVEPGNNYGWPVVGRGVNYGAGAPIHQSISQDGMVNPIHFWVPSIAASGLTIYTGSRFPMWHGNVFAGGMAGEQLARLTLSEDGARVITEETLLPGIGRIRDVRQGPDGLLYIAIEDRSRAPTAILRLEPAQ